MSKPKMLAYAGIVAAIFAVTGLAAAADLVRDYFAAEAQFKAAEAQFLKANAAREAALRQAEPLNRLSTLGSDMGRDFDTALANQRQAVQQRLKAAEAEMKTAQSKKDEVEKQLERMRAQILQEETSTLQRLEKKIDTLIQKMEVLEKK